jgi:2-hydroxycyclohexanecarboxyl-CoA dehydrogenase
MVSETALIAGLDTDVAQAMTQRLRGRGCRVALIGPNMAAHPPQGTAELDAMDCDLSDRAAIDAVFMAIDERLGPLDHLVFGAGAPAFAVPFDAITRMQWDDTVEANLTAAFHLCQATMPRLVARQRGSVGFVLSDYPIIGRRDGAAFTASQTALYSFAKSVAREFAPMGIRVNCVGMVPADDLAGAPMGEFAAPEDVAAIADFLLSERASYMTGQLLQPNSGRVMW